MNFRSLIKNASVAFLAQGIAMVVSIVTTLVVPKILGVEEYGYWQLFIFYSSYVGFGHLGLNDGVYLINGGLSREKIDKRSINSQLVVSLCFQLVLSAVVMAAITQSDLGEKRDFVISATAVYMVIQNTALYFGYVFQAMNETMSYSKSCIIERLCFAGPMIILVIMRTSAFELYVVAYCFSSLVQLVYCLWHARDFFSMGLEPSRLAITESIASVKVGIKLMLANVASMLILGVARFVIDAVWGIETFGQLSLSISMVNFFLAFISQASMVLFPELRQSGEEDRRRFFRAARDAMSLLFPVVYILYYPICWLLALWLPAYANSLAYFAYLIPICVFDSKMNISCTTLFKVIRKEKTLFYINLGTTLVSAAGSLVGAYLLHSVNYVIAAVTVAIIGRSVFSEYLLTKRLNVPTGAKITVSELVVTLAFIVVAGYFGTTLGALLIYIIVYCAFAFFNAGDMANVLRDVRKAAKLK